MGTMRVASGGAWVIPKYLRAGSSAVKSVKVAVNGVWQTVWSALSATIAGGSVDFNLGNKATPTTRAMSVGCSVTANSGGQPVSYQWTVTAIGTGLTGVSLGNPNSAGVTVNATATLNREAGVSLQCVVSSNGSSVVLNTSASFNYYNTI